ncbi:MAG: NAD(+) synthase [bacterium]|nr:NAD(+) synthase [bacterium]
MYGFYRVAAAVPEIKIADVEFNTKEIINQVEAANKNSAALILFPELSITGYTCADLFLQPLLVNSSLSAIEKIAQSTRELDIISIVGAPVYHQNKLYNCAVIIHQGAIKGIVPKTYNPNYKEFYEKRWFTPAVNIANDSINLNGSNIPFGTNIIFEYDQYFKFAIEICEDLWTVIPPSSYHSIAGATVILNLSASNELVSKADYRRSLVRQQSARCMAAYVYTSSGVHESTTDLVFSGDALVVENGSLVCENERFNTNSSIIYADIDCERLFTSRISETSFTDCPLPPEKIYKTIKVDKINLLNEKNLPERYIDPHPFVPSNPEQRSNRCREIFKIQSSGLAKRMKHTNIQKAVVGISGGLDSTLALLVIAEAFKILGKDPKDILGITMPGFGTTDRTFNNAVDLCKEIGADLREINIKDACMQHFKDIGHDPADHSVTYENVQARERTQVLMDMANKENGLVIGTGDLSEIALGWSTYNGDHMSMYAVNCSVPKTLIRFLIQWVADTSGSKLKKILEDIIATPVSPELLPNRKDQELNQKTEDIIGPYELHDFFLYHIVKYGAQPKKVAFLAFKAFNNKYDEATIKKWLKVFTKRFFSQQFKRSCIPDGPKVGTISLSPRGDWRMPSDAADSLWQGEIT